MKLLLIILLGLPQILLAGASAYVISQSNQIQILSGTGFATPSTIPLPIAGTSLNTELALSPNGQVGYFVNSGADGSTGTGGQIYIINLTGQKIASTLGPPVFTGFTQSGGPSIALSPNGETLYVACFADVEGDQSVIQIIDTNRLVQTGTINIDSPGDMAFLPDGSKCYIATANSVQVIQCNATPPAVIKTIDTITQPVAIAVTPTAPTYVYVLDDGNATVTVINPVTDTVVQTMGGFNVPIDLVFLSDTSYLYVLNQSSGTISIITLLNGLPQSLYETVPLTLCSGCLPQALAIDPTGNYIYIGLGAQVGILNVSTNGITYLNEPSIAAVDVLGGVANSPTPAVLFQSRK